MQSWSAASNAFSCQQKSGFPCLPRISSSCWRVITITVVDLPQCDSGKTQQENVVAFFKLLLYSLGISSLCTVRFFHAWLQMSQCTFTWRCVPITWVVPKVRNPCQLFSEKRGLYISFNSFCHICSCAVTFASLMCATFASTEGGWRGVQLFEDLEDLIEKKHKYLHINIFVIMVTVQTKLKVADIAKR